MLEQLRAIHVDRCPSDVDEIVNSSKVTNPLIGLVMMHSVVFRSYSIVGPGEVGDHNSAAGVRQLEVEFGFREPRA
jgi:hypothetical protein